MEVAVIGGGIVGVCNAYFLAAAGHRVTVFERNASVAEESSFANAGLIAPGVAAPWAAPGMPGRILSHILLRSRAVTLRPALDRALWRWIRQWLSECRLDRYQINRGRMQRLTSYSSELVRQLSVQHELDYESGHGVLQLLRTERELRSVRPALDLLADSGIPHSLLDAEAARCIEPALSPSTPIAAALYFPEDGAGNCALFAKQLKAVAQTMGVRFRFRSSVSSLTGSRHQVALRVNDETVTADAAVIAAGIGSVPLLASLGVQIPLYPVAGYSATATIRNLEHAPVTTLIDEAHKVTITRIGNRLRVAGIAELGINRSEPRPAAVNMLFRVAEEWLPLTANYQTAHIWRGARPMLPDDVPLLGASPVNNIYLNIGHGSCGWAMAAACGKILADMVSGGMPEIDMEGLTLARYG